MLYLFKILNLRYFSRHQLSIIFIVLFTLTFGNSCIGQNYLLSNEQIIFSFNTEKDRRMVLAKDSSDQYIVYRYGTKNKIELEFPGKTKESWSKFTYSYYLRGGGSENEGLDLNNVYFCINDFKYIIYDFYSASDDKTRCGIEIINLITKKAINIEGYNKSVTGTLIGLRDNEMIKISDEIDE